MDWRWLSRLNLTRLKRAWIDSRFAPGYSMCCCGPQGGIADMLEPPVLLVQALAWELGGLQPCWTPDSYKSRVASPERFSLSPRTARLERPLRSHDFMLEAFEVSSLSDT
jgi:hypothetical protein